MAGGLGRAAFLSAAQEATWSTAIGSPTIYQRIRGGSGFDYDPGYLEPEDLPGGGATMQDAVQGNQAFRASYTVTPQYEGMELFERTLPASYAFATPVSANTHTFEVGAASQMFDGSGDEPQTVTLFQTDSTLTDKTRQGTSCFLISYNYTIPSSGFATCAMNFAGETESSLAITDPTASFSTSPYIQARHLSISNVDGSESALASAIVHEASINITVPWSVDRYGHGSGVILSPYIVGPIEVSGSFTVEMEDPTKDYTAFSTFNTDGTPNIQENVTILANSGINAVGSDTFRKTWKVHRLQYATPSDWKPQDFGIVRHVIPWVAKWDSGASSILQIVNQNAAATAA